MLQVSRLLPTANAGATPMVGYLTAPTSPPHQAHQGVQPPRPGLPPTPPPPLQLSPTPLISIWKSPRRVPTAELCCHVCHIPIVFVLFSLGMYHIHDAADPTRQTRQLNRFRTTAQTCSFHLVFMRRGSASPRLLFPHAMWFSVVRVPFCPSKHRLR